MSFSIGAALKKVAVSLLTDKKVLKWAGGIVLGALIIIMIPFAVIISLGSGQIKIDTEGLKAAVQAELNEADLAKSEQIDKVLNQITTKMKAKKFSQSDHHQDESQEIYRRTDSKGAHAILRRAV